MYSFLIENNSEDFLRLSLDGWKIWFFWSGIDEYGLSILKGLSSGFTFFQWVKLDENLY